MHNGNASHPRWPISAVWSTVPAWERRLRGWLTPSRCKDGSPGLPQGPEEALFSVRTPGRSVRSRPAFQGRTQGTISR